MVESGTQLNPELCPPVEGADDAVSAWITDECNRELGQELLPEEEHRAELGPAAEIQELDG